jgi:hypothetical protein
MVEAGRVLDPAFVYMAFALPWKAAGRVVRGRLGEPSAACSQVRLKVACSAVDTAVGCPENMVEERQDLFSRFRVKSHVELNEAFHVVCGGFYLLEAIITLGHGIIPWFRRFRRFRR